MDDFLFKQAFSVSASTVWKSTDSRATHNWACVFGCRNVHYRNQLGQANGIIWSLVDYQSAIQSWRLL